MSLVLKLIPDFESYKKARRFVRLVIGCTLFVFGLLLIFLPGPAIVVIPFALAILAGEFLWAKVIFKRAKYHMGRYKDSKGKKTSDL